MSFNTVSVVGLGYIGLPTAAMFASRRIKVIGVDVNEHAVDTINRGEIHIVEPELDILVHAAVTEGYLRATLTPEPADAFLIAVPTPFKGDNEPDLSYIKAATEAIAPVLEKGNLVVLESTSPVGATEKVAEWLAKFRPDLSFPQQNGETADINVAHCPERVLPGHVVRELVENDRVIGGMSKRCSDRSVELYKMFVEGECIITNARTAEMAKLTENAYRDVNIAFANELSIISDKLDINVWELIRLSNHHPRVNILQPGPGVGGHCIAVDPWFIVSKTPKEARLIHAAREVNDSKPAVVIESIVKKANELKTNKVICLGIAFKPDIDDLRESPSCKIVTELLDRGFDVGIVEPNIDELSLDLKRKGASLMVLGDVLTLNDSEYIGAILVAHKEFRGNDALKKANKIDFCGALEAIR